MKSPHISHLCSVSLNTFHNTGTQHKHMIVKAQLITAVRSRNLYCTLVIPVWPQADQVAY